MRYKIVFKDTGGTRTVTSQTITSGMVRDYLKPTYYGKGYLGREYPNVEHGGKKKKLWVAMLSRCYNPKDDSYEYYGAKGVTVSSEWHDYSRFCKDLPNVDGWDEERFYRGELQLDKDKKKGINGGKVYSLDSCTFLTPKENSHYSTYDRQRTFSALSPEGKYFSEERNIADFCEEQGIPDRNAIYEAIDAREKGKLRIVKGWVFGKSNESKESLTREMVYKHFLAESPKGEKQVFKSVKELIDSHPEIVGEGTNKPISSRVSKCLSGKVRKYKGWTFTRVNDLPYKEWKYYISKIM